MEVLDIYKEIGTNEWENRLEFQCNATKEYFRTFVKKFSNQPTYIQIIQDKIRQFRTIQETDSIESLFLTCKSIEVELSNLQEKPEEWEKEGKSQIVFTQDWSKPFNQIPFLLPAAALFKIYIFPFFAVLLPLIAWILPYAIVRLFFKVPMPFDTYIQMMLNMWMGGRKWAEMDFWGQLRIVFQTSWTAFGLFQGMYQPIQQAYHTKTLDEQVVKQGTLLQTFVVTAKQLFYSIEKQTGLPVHCYGIDSIPLDEPRQTYAYLREYTHDLQWIWEKIAELEMIWRLARNNDLCFVQFKKSQSPFLEIKEFFDPSIHTKEPVKSSCLFTSEKHHAILTGPNKGGKSSILRAICLNVWLAQTVGVAFAKEMTLTPFSWVRSGLRLADTPGEESLFEREVLFATKTLSYARKKSIGFGLVLYDECFHSTNPPDAEKTANHFLNHLWASSTTLSVVSTHVFSLVEKSPHSIQRICVPAEESSTGLQYSFQLAPGICKVSSVEEIYKKYNFPKSPTAVK